MARKIAVVVTGDRNAERDDWEDAIRDRFDAIESVISHRNIVLIHGDAKGIDSIADEIGESLGWNVIPMPADWAEYGNSAGPRRNTLMIRVQEILYALGYERLVLAFHDNITQSKGTKDCVEQAGRFGVRTKVVGSDGRDR